MRRLIFLLLVPFSAMAQDLPPGVESLRMLGGWPTEDGHRMIAMELRLKPGWKTYWRSPGDAGIPPSFDWSGSENAGEVTIHWPRPEVIDSGGDRSLGYHGELILPIEIAPTTHGKPINIRGTVDFGLCQDVCVPAHVDFAADGPMDRHDPRILAALDAAPQQAATQPQCRIEEISDGMRVVASLPAGDVKEPAAALELGDDDQIWISAPEITLEGGRLSISADFVAGSGRPFALDPDDLRLTLVDDGNVVEYRGCAAG